MYRNGQGIGNLQDKTLILVDDGVATGATMKAAIEALRRKQVRKLIVAVPVAPRDTAEELRSMVDAFICLDIPEYFMAVGCHYDEFPQVTDAEVVAILGEFRERLAA